MYVGIHEQEIVWQRGRNGEDNLVSEGDGFSPYLVSAVAKDCPANSSIQFNILYLLRFRPRIKTE